jgi:hypothetical protein
VERIDYRGNRLVLVAVCDCGRKKPFDPSNLRHGRSKSCGCGIGDAIRLAVTKHGHSKKPEYSAWVNMLKRCTDSDHPSYRHYGGRGIEVHKDWWNFENFFADVGPRPSPQHSLDRFPNNNGNYEPGNCRWATQREQMNNTRAVHNLEYQGRKQSIAEWSRATGISQRALSNRISRGWPIERALTQPASRRIQLRNGQLYGEKLA